ncbi:MAG: glycosyltransferase family 39 protein [Xanthomonadales bacterium]|nr:glycosyltransferase family 39 protein [Xanthomonadales bacterium]
MNADPAREQSRRRGMAAVFLALFALSHGLLWYAYYGHGAKPLIGDEQHYQATALSILTGGSWMQGSIWPPLQPLLLAATYRIFGVHVLAAQVLQGLLFIGCGVLLRDLWRQLGGGVRAANAATALFLLSPGIAAYAQWLWPEIPHLALLLAALCLLARAPAPGRGFAAGACIGLAILAKSLLAGFWPVFLLAFVRGHRPRFAWAAALAFAGGLALPTTPALLEGWHRHGRPMIADSSAYNLWIGLTDRWRSDYVEDMGGRTLPAFLASGETPAERNALYLDKARTLVERQGLLPTLAEQSGRQYFRLFSAKTPLVSQLPGPACAGHLSVYRTPPWLTRTLTLGNDLAHALILAAAALGVACWRRRPGRMMAIIAVFSAYQLALFLVLHVKARFLLPMLPFLCGFAGSFLTAWRAAPAGACPPQSHPAVAPAPSVAMVGSPLSLSPGRLGIGALLAALLLVLAFAGPLLDRSCAG